ncbi:hypothetical protein H0H87_008805 [Tephrocybe sp. NHM501043]|nr:hypothetical protein H0H87_008805 [Tephrocybe sp. NHM501043]
MYIQLQDAVSFLNSPLTATVLCVVAVFIVLAWSTVPSTVPDLPGPRGWPIVGSIFQRGSDPAETYLQWSKIYGPVFRVRLGDKWVIVINSADSVEELLVSSQYAATFQSRPMPYTLAKLLGGASRRAITLGTSPYDDDLKAKRRLAIASVSPAISRLYDPVVERAVQYFVRIFNTASTTGGPVDPAPLFVDGSAVLNLTIICGASVDNAATLLRDSPHPMKRLGQFVYNVLYGRTNADRYDRVRNINGHMRDYLPFLRVLPDGKMFKEAVTVAKYRSLRLTELLDRIKRLHHDGSAPPCAIISILKESREEISEESLTSFANTMVSSGLDSHLPNTLLWGLGILASRKDIQDKAYQSILRQDELGDAMNFDRDNYLFAFVKELGRYFNTFRLGLARETIGKDLVWRGHFIPQGTTVLCNTHAMNRGKGFKPVVNSMHFVHKELYAIYKQILLNWSISIYDGEREFDAIKGCADGFDFNQAPKKYRVTLTVKDQQKLDAYLKANI